MSDICVVCGDNVHERQQGIQCDECSDWTHRTCGTGWHHRLNRKAGYQALTFYRLVPALRSEAESLEYELRHLQDGVSTRRVRPAVRNVEQKIQALWEEYRERRISTSELLRGCAQAYGPQCERPASATDEPMVTRL